MAGTETAIVTGASRGIGAAITKAFLERGYNVVATSRGISKSDLSPSPQLALVDGDISHESTAANVMKTAVDRFGAVNHVVNNAGLFAAKPFTEYTVEEFRNFVSVNLEGFIFTTQIALKHMLAGGLGGSVTTITAALADNPIVGVPASIPMITKGGLNAITRSLANEYAKERIRFNAVAPGVVDTPMHENDQKSSLESLNPMGAISKAKDIADAVVFLAEARYVTGEVLHVDCGAHLGRW
jgi:NAD(P)-dependent dehydrogenase (short-subunit alcohol dehydrogenase family)